jgi:hypothetical protein
MSNTCKNFAVLLLAASAASVYAESDSSAGQRVEIRANPTALAAARVVLEKRNVDAVFPMSSGRSLEVLSAGDTLSVRYGHLHGSTLRHDGQGNFVSQDRKMTMQFKLDSAGDVQTASMSIPSTWR